MVCSAAVAKAMDGERIVSKSALFLLARLMIWNVSRVAHVSSLS
jgi:hypothetical protein